uniref:uncharacterized protein LOC122583297 n=1 Tax=Erigeron canadensis TaxID=72917 RepID=UPI001CB94339|nr:uncharacterized protein LOC122583297 [Erigeron canadensis]
MPKRLFLKIVHDLESRYAYFQDSYDAQLAKSFTPIQKCTSAIRQLATGNPPDEYDEYLEMAGRTSRECLQLFCDAIVDTYKTEYLCKPTTHDLQRLFEAHEERHHLPGMIDSLDCTHLVWKMCPMEWGGQYKKGDHEYPTIMLEATASQDLWLWHAFFGPPGALNDINVLQQSPFFLPERMGTAPYVPFSVNGRT